ncbi:MAG: glucose-6-phosphate isomerase [Gammaproteobacteria bacterium]
MTSEGRTPRNPAATSAWRNLKKHQKKIAATHMADLFAADPDRPAKFAAEIDGLYVDYSKHRATEETFSLLLALAEETGVPHAIQQLFEGARVNVTEQRPALHTALRTPPDDAAPPEGKHNSMLVRNELARMEEFVGKLHEGAATGCTGRPLDTLVNIGIGGSDLGPRLAVDALRPWRRGSLRIHFAANVDPVEMNNVLAECNPETTLFIVSSKSFATAETLANAQLAQHWLRKHGCRNQSAHFFAITANQDAATRFGIAPERIFHTWDWVGGRYSVWSATGLPLAVAIGMENFRAFLAGAHAMDLHFRHTPLPRNVPVLLALLDIWYINFFHCETLAVIPYTHALKLLPQYLGQLCMESNGKSIRRDNGAVRYPTSAVVWGGTGANAQHAFMQLLHQGTHLVPVDFLAGVECDGGPREQHQQLLANCIAQSKALMLGNSTGPDAEKRKCKIMHGNKPSTTILYERLTPATLGKLLALYEHRTCVQACLWNINAYDQWGVELGKTIAAGINAELNGGSSNPTHDASTRELLRRCNRKA